MKHLHPPVYGSRYVKAWLRKVGFGAGNGGSFVNATERQELERQLCAAQAELESWKDQSFTRNDGSPAQDLRFETRGDNLRTRVEELERMLKSSKAE